MSTDNPVTQFLLSKIGIEPTAKQWPIINCDKRDILVAGGERGGKSKTAAIKGLIEITAEDPDLYWLVAADYERTRAEFDYLIEFFAKIGAVQTSSKRVDPGFILLHDGTLIETKSAKDPRTLAMKAPKGIIVCEASQVDFETYMKCIARLAEKRGWLFMAGTFESSLGWYPQLFTAWQMGVGEQQSFSLPSPSNTYIYPGGENDPEILRLKAQTSDAFFMERIMGIPVPPKGLVFTEFRPDIHVKDIEWVPEEPVFLWQDPGYAGAYAVEVGHEINGQIQIFDEVYTQGLVTEEVIQICTEKPWWKDVASGVIDLAGYQHQAMSAPAEVWMEKTGIYLSAQKIRINDGTERLKGFLKPNPLNGVPKIVFSPKCKGILSEFGVEPNPFDGQTRVYAWKTDRDGNIVGQTPEDKNNHGIKAIIYGLIDRYGYAYLEEKQKMKVTHW